MKFCMIMPARLVTASSKKDEIAIATVIANTGRCFHQKKGGGLL